jgi:hypothetical protein
VREEMSRRPAPRTKPPDVPSDGTNTRGCPPSTTCCATPRSASGWLRTGRTGVGLPHHRTHPWRHTQRVAPLGPLPSWRGQDVSSGVQSGELGHGRH